MVLYFHGGSFILGGLDSHDDVCAELCARTRLRGRVGATIVWRRSTGTRRLSTTRWRRSNGRRQTYNAAIVLAAIPPAAISRRRSATRRAGMARAPIGQVLIYPGLADDRSGPSYRDHAEAPMLTRARPRLLPEHPRRRTRPAKLQPVPACRRDFSRLPPTVVITAECDPLSRDGETYRDRIIAAGGKAWWYEEPGLVHGYLRARHTVGTGARKLFTHRRGGVGARPGEWPAV